MFGLQLPVFNDGLGVAQTRFVIARAVPSWDCMIVLGRGSVVS